MREFICDYCGKPGTKDTSAFNRARAIGAHLYCNKVCTGLARRLANPPTEAERKEAKRLYDAKRRSEKAAEIKAKKAEYFKRTYDPEQAAIARKARMPSHIEYCRRPEYKAWKAEYDRRLRARPYGEFAEAFLLLQDVEREVLARATRYEIMLTNGTLNKAQARRRAL